MADKKMRRMKRKDLLELLVAQGEENEALKEQLAQAKAALEQRTIKINETGSIAEASLQVSGVFAAAEEAAQQYLENIRLRDERQEEVCREMVAKAQREADDYWAQVDGKVRELLQSHETLIKLLDGRYTQEWKHEDS